MTENQLFIWLRARHYAKSGYYRNELAHRITSHFHDTDCITPHVPITQEPLNDVSLFRRRHTAPFAEPILVLNGTGRLGEQCLHPQQCRASRMPKGQALVSAKRHQFTRPITKTLVAAVRKGNGAWFSAEVPVVAALANVPHRTLCPTKRRPRLRRRSAPG